jgi:N utilization substance protein A
MLNLVETFSEFKDGKNIDRPTMVRVLEDVFRTLIKKKFGSDENFDVIVNTQKGDLELWRVREIVPDGEVADEKSQISISEAISIDADYEVGEECYEQLQLEDFGRRSIMAARQTLISRIMDLEKEEVFKKYNDRLGEIVTAEVHQILKKEILIVDDATGNELILPKTEMIKGDYYRKGDLVKAVIKSVEMRNNNPTVIASRTDALFLEKLLEQEVPEIEDGLITIRKIVRMPGERAKVAVESFDDRIDPVGACVGMKGSRIHGIVRELRNENIDVINYTTNNQLLIQRALSPAKVTSMEILEEDKRVKVFLRPDQVSLAIGKGGNNIKLAGRLCGYEIDVYRDGEVDVEDVDLEEFADEIDSWIIDELKAIGCDTAKSVLEIGVNDLVQRTDLEKETIEEVFRILKAEFE